MESSSRKTEKYKMHEPRKVLTLSTKRYNQYHAKGHLICQTSLLKNSMNRGSRLKSRSCSLSLRLRARNTNYIELLSRFSTWIPKLTEENKSILPGLSAWQKTSCRILFQGDSIYCTHAERMPCGTLFCALLSLPLFARPFSLFLWT